MVVKESYTIALEQPVSIRVVVIKGVVYTKYLLYRCRTARSCFFFFSSRRRHTRFDCDWSSDVCSSDLSDSRSVYVRESGQPIHAATPLMPVYPPAARRGASFSSMRSSQETAGSQIGRASCRERV